MRSFVAASLAMLVLAVPLAASEVTLQLKGNQKVSGKLEKVEGDKVTLSQQGQPVTVFVSDLVPASRAKLAEAMEARLKKTDASGFLELGDFCVRHGLWAPARRAYQRAVTIDGAYVTKSLADAGLAEADRLESRALYQSAVDHQQAGREAEARAAAEEIGKRFPASPYAEPAKKLLAVLAAKPGTPPATPPKAGPPPKQGPPPGGQGAPPGGQQAGAKPPPAGPPPKKPSSPYLRYLQQLLEEIEEHRKLALKLEGDGHHQKAVKELEAALKKLDQVEKSVAALAQQKDPAVAEEAAKLAADRQARRIRLYLQLAHLNAAINQLRQATAYVNQVLTLEPENKQALALRDKITEEQMRRVIDTSGKTPPK